MDLRLALDVLLFSGIVLFGVGFFWKDRRCHLARGAAWTAFGVFWFLQVPAFLGLGDAVNSLGAAAALPVFLFLAAHEKRSYDWREEYAPLRVLAGGAVFAAGIFFTIHPLPAPSGGVLPDGAEQKAPPLHPLAPRYSPPNLALQRHTGA